MRTMTRRRFIGKAAAAVAAPCVIPGSALGLDGAVAPSNRITIGHIGIGGMGCGHVHRTVNTAGCQLLALCDVWEPIRRELHAMAETRYAGIFGKGAYKGIDAYNDFRDLLARDDIDAVVIAAPDHWHAIMTIQACKAGKDVYCEKPLSLTIRDGRKMVETARRYGRVVMGGSQRILGEWGQLAHYTRGGGVGKILSVSVSVGIASRDCCLPAAPVPEGFDYELWLGPAPQQPYHPGRVGSIVWGADFWNAFNKNKGTPGHWRLWRDFSGGDRTDNGAHFIGGAIFSAGVETTGPAEIVPPGEKEYNGRLTLKYANGLLLHFGAPPGKPLGYGDALVRGAEGEILRSAKTFPPAPNPVHFGYKGQGGIFNDFLHCIRTRERPFQDVEIAHRAASTAHLSNIAEWLKRPIKWDPDKEEIIGDAEAARWLDRPKREPWNGYC